MKKLFPDEKVIVTKYFNAHQDWEVPIPGFFVIAGVRKFRSFADMTDDEAKDFITLLRLVRQGMRDVLGIEMISVFQNEEASHFHTWIFPRYEWMERFGMKIQSIRPIMEHAKENMINESSLSAVRESAQKMREYFEGMKD
jgi:diadenosine tetraphosphate (Ap4A) HIT family hydrolase